MMTSPTIALRETGKWIAALGVIAVCAGALLPNFESDKVPYPILLIVGAILSPLGWTDRLLAPLLWPPFLFGVLFGVLRLALSVASVLMSDNALARFTRMAGAIVVAVAFAGCWHEGNQDIQWLEQFGAIGSQHNAIWTLAVWLSVVTGGVAIAVIMSVQAITVPNAALAWIGFACCLSMVFAWRLQCEMHVLYGFGVSFVGMLALTTSHVLSCIVSRGEKCDGAFGGR